MSYLNHRASKPRKGDVPQQCLQTRKVVKKYYLEEIDGCDFL